MSPKDVTRTVQQALDASGACDVFVGSDSPVSCIVASNLLQHIRISDEFVGGLAGGAFVGRREREGGRRGQMDGRYGSENRTGRING